VRGGGAGGGGKQLSEDSDGCVSFRFAVSPLFSSHLGLLFSGFCEVRGVDLTLGRTKFLEIWKPSQSESSIFQFQKEKSPKDRSPASHHESKVGVLCYVGRHYEWDGGN